jgi:thiol:disulfide interchange protein
MFLALWSLLWANLQFNLSKYTESHKNWLVIELVIPKGHYVYGKKTDGNATPLDVTVEGVPHDQLKFECPIFDKEMELDIYKDNIIILVPIGKTTPKEIKITYGMCTDVVCLPPSTITKEIAYEQLVSTPGDIFKRYKDLCLQKKTWSLLPILLAFFGGMLLNIMPCVLPVLSIKVLSFLTHAETRFQSSLLYSLGNITTFVTLGLLTGALKTMGTVSGWGFHLQNPLFVFALACLFVIMIMSILDLIIFPIFQAATPRSSFLTGVMTVLVGAPCTVPMMSTAVSYGLTQTALESVLIFAALGIGMSTPFLLLSIFPMRILPKPGPWLLFVKPSLGFVLIVTVLWLLQIYTALTSLDHFLVISTVLVGLAYVLWLWGQQLLKGWLSLLLGIGIVSVGVIQTLHHPLVSIPYSETQVEATIKDGKNVLIYATAKWCLTCKVNAMVLQKESVQKALQNSNTVLITADYTQQAEDITMLLRKHNLAGVPATIFLSKDKAIVLPEILTESFVLKALQRKK